jgi:hypothetical protein
MARSKKLLITLQEYERIFRVIHGVLRNEKGNLERACLFFGIVGARILERHYKLRATPVVGYSIYKVSADYVLVLGSSPFKVQKYNFNNQLVAQLVLTDRS